MGMRASRCRRRGPWYAAAAPSAAPRAQGKTGDAAIASLRRLRSEASLPSHLKVAIGAATPAKLRRIDCR